MMTDEGRSCLESSAAWLCMRWSSKRKKDCFHKKETSQVGRVTNAGIMPTTTIFLDYNAAISTSGSGPTPNVREFFQVDRVRTQTCRGTHTMSTWQLGTCMWLPLDGRCDGKYGDGIRPEWCRDY
jgi:hypothetical protein